MSTIADFMKHRIIHDTKDEFAIVLYNTVRVKQTRPTQLTLRMHEPLSPMHARASQVASKNQSNHKHVYVLQNLEQLSASNIQALQELVEGGGCVSKRIAVTDCNSFGRSHWLESTWWRALHVTQMTRL
jgi:hypothetical protein